MPDEKDYDGLQVALQRITEAKYKGSAALSLAGLGLMAVPEEIAQLSNLQELDLNNNHISIITASITQLSRLRKLILKFNRVDSISDAIVQLSLLDELDLSFNNFTQFPMSVAQLSNLRGLYLGNSGVRFIPDSIAQLCLLQHLDLSFNQITVIPGAIAKLSQLRSLSLSSNSITEVPGFIAGLSRLQALYLSGNKITKIPEVVAQLSQLESLGLAANGIRSIPNHVAWPPKLRELILGSDELYRSVYTEYRGAKNRITAIPESITQLPQLEVLDLSNNLLTTVPEKLAQVPNLRKLFLHGNPGLGIPAEILGPTAKAVNFEGQVPRPPLEILAYLTLAATDSRPLNEAKLILVGQGAVGKTSLVKSLSTGKFKKGEKTTEGIKISDWECPINKQDTVTVHIWDFGGQEMMHATHQFFLTQRSLYLLVLNRRQGGTDREADYWFRLIRAFGGKDAPVLVVLNKQRSEPFDVNREGWLEKYRGNIKGFVLSDCEDKKSITQLKREIVKELTAMESLKARFPRRWFAIKNTLSQMAAEHITFDDYRKLCQRLGEGDPASQTSLAGFLHDLGIALNYGQDPRLRFNYVLKPEWVTQGIYALLHAFVRQKGVFTHAEAEKELSKKRYSPEDTHFILGLMERFDLSFPLDEKPRRVLIPELLDDQQPKDAANFKPAECLNFGYKYPVLTEGLLPRFVARTHHLGQMKTRWKSGVILEDPSSGCRALVRADAAEAVVRVHIDGPQEGRRELLGIIRYNFEVIHSDYEFKPEALVYSPEAPQEALSVKKLEVLARTKATVDVVLPNHTSIEKNIAELIDPVMSTPAPLKLFLSYSHLDERSIDELRKDLRVMERNGLMRPWYDRALTAGEKWEPAILNELKAAEIVVCQISRNYLASDACMAELNAAIERSASLEATVVAYVLNDCGWKEEKRLREFQLLPTDGKPLSDWKDENKYWRAVAEGIQKAIKKFQRERKSMPQRAGMEN
jgi:internalin A